MIDNFTTRWPHKILLKIFQNFTTRWRQRLEIFAKNGGKNFPQDGAKDFKFCQKYFNFFPQDGAKDLKLYQNNFPLFSFNKL